VLVADDPHAVVQYPLLQLDGVEHASRRPGSDIAAPAYERELASECLQAADSGTAVAQLPGARSLRLTAGSVALGEVVIVGRFPRPPKPTGRRSCEA
jgi:hypothetical protein